MNVATISGEGLVRESVKQLAMQYATPNEEPQFKATMVLVAALFLGPNEGEIANLTGYTPEYVNEIAERLRASGLWTEAGVDYLEWDPDTRKGYLRFVMDLSVAQGMLFRTGEKRNGRYIYESVDTSRKS